MVQIKKLIHFDAVPALAMKMMLLLAAPNLQHTLFYANCKDRHFVFKKYLDLSYAR
jgi:hypothetical protein